jgi:DNA-binding MarR family transcriptional regulator
MHHSKSCHAPDGFSREGLSMARSTRTVIRLTGNFFGIPNNIIDTHGRTLGAIGVGIYTALARYADRQTGECWPAIAKIERVLGLARSTVKVYLHKLEALGLIEIEERWDAAGDRTTNLYTLLDASPAAIARHLAARAAEDARSQERAATGLEGGGSADDPPSVATQPTGGSGADPEQTHSSQTERNKPECLRVEETPTPTTTNPCPHPAPEISCIDGMHICHHCWTIVEQHDAICHLVDVAHRTAQASCPEAA